MASTDIKFSENATRFIHKLSGMLHDLLIKYALVSAYNEDRELVTTVEVYKALDAAIAELKNLKRQHQKEE